MRVEPEVTVVIIFYEAARFLPAAIASVFGQRYGAWELLLVDDGSRDGGPALARAYAAAHPGRVRYLAHPGGGNRGMSATRNLGVRHAAGRYVAFLDADDVWLPHKLTEQVALLEAHPTAAMVYGRSQWWYSWTEQPEGRRRDFTEALGVPPDTLIAPPTLLVRSLVGKAITPCPSDVLLRREAIARVGGFEESFRGIYEDQAFFAKLCLTAPIFAAGACWDRYRQHPDSCVAAVQRAGMTDIARRRYLEWLAGYLRAQGGGDWAVRRALGRALGRALRPYHHPRLHRLGVRLAPLTAALTRWPSGWIREVG